ncbi:axin interactor, dorsalization-associated protein-like [Halichondria panicea]|uniref:axin interactor, dorsalization-associated protein-like n=1 Tax=Halichondria panicea TaxID=6063 RepID=UPI00312B62EC
MLCNHGVCFAAGSLITSRDMLPGLNYLTISIDKFGIKDPQYYLDPYISVSVKNFHGDDIEVSQDTPLANQKEGSHIQFGVSVLIRSPLEELPEGAAIFFEFKHYKPNKKRVSTKCFSFMEMDEIKPGKAALEIYKKPTDFHRKKLSLLSAKPLYLQLTLNIHKS